MVEKYPNEKYQKSYIGLINSNFFPSQHIWNIFRWEKSKQTENLPNSTIVLSLFLTILLHLQMNIFGLVLEPPT